MRALTIFAALALVLGGIALARAADPAPVHNQGKVTVDKSVPQFDNVGGVMGQSIGFGSSINAQISISAIVCPILTSLLATFGPILAPVINSLRVLFGCSS